MIKSLILFSLLLLNLEVYSQTWPTIFGTNSNCWGNGIVETYDKGYMLNIQVDPGPGVSQIHSWLQKTDINGNPLWSKKIYSSSYSLGGLDIDTTNDHGLILTGATYKYDSDNADIFFMKINSCGEKEWCSVLSTPGNPDYGIKIESLNDGYLLLASYYTDVVNKRVWLFKLDLNGTLLWQQCYLDTIVDLHDAEPYNVTITTDNKYIISTDSYVYNGTIWRLRPVLIKTSSDGILQWVLRYGVNNGFRGDIPTYTEENNTGKFYSSVRRFRNSPPLGDSPAFIKFSESGEEDYFKDLVTNSIAGGSTTVNLHNNDSLFISAEWWDVNNILNIGFFKTDTLGNISKTKILYQGIYYGFHDTFFNSDDYYMASGYLSMNNDPVKVYLYKFTRNLEIAPFDSSLIEYDNFCPHPIVTDTINLDDCAVITKIAEPENENSIKRIHIYPNPASKEITIELPERLLRKTTAGQFKVTTVFYQWDKCEVEIYSTDGKMIFFQEVSNKQKKMKIDLYNWKPGLYVLKMNYKNVLVASSKFIVKE